jgi:ATP-dependent Lhr-like helicase
VRTGDTPQKERAAMRKLAPHILVTTPESLYVLMGSASGREGLANVHTVVDEIHALAGNKRGATWPDLERLQACAPSHCGASACPPRNARSNGWRSFWSVAGAPAPCRYRPCAQARPGHRSAAGAAGCGDGQRCLGLVYDRLACP